MADLSDLSGGARFLEFPRTRIEISGNDRASFLHNFCTADIRQLKPRQLREAFVLNLKGKIVGHIHVLCHAQTLELVTVPMQAEKLINHFENYLIREKVSFRDLSEQRTSAFVFPEAGEGLRALLQVAANEWNTFQSVEAGGMTLEIARGEFSGPGYLITAEADGRSKLDEWCLHLGLQRANWDEAMVHRLNYGFPWFGIDIDEGTLPQELRRDQSAISFEKGCYLGQETVARIDALGHVNRLLIVARMHAAPGNKLPLDLKIQGESVGRLTSVVWSAAADAFLGMGLVKRAQAAIGTELEVESTRAIVIDTLPAAVS